MTRPFAISPTDLWRALFAAEQPVLLDIRIEADLAEIPLWLPAAHRVAFDDMPALVRAAETAPWAVVICHGGLKLSQGVASRLQARGLRAGYVEGGILAWQAPGLPLCTRHEPLWVASWEEPVAPWLAARLLPKPVEILQVAPGQVEKAAQKFDATVLPNATDLLSQVFGASTGMEALTKALATEWLATLARGFQRRGTPEDISAVLDALVLAEAA